ncbi:TPA: PTS sorbitol transporter subunit IIA, partial [Enterococcus faecium]|nr:PTS sorbitol transporter subunit IIA [Enterococcus faecium]
NELGHITIKFDGSHEPELPGTMYVEDKEMPHLRKGTIIKIDQEDQNGGKLYGNHA